MSKARAQPPVYSKLRKDLIKDLKIDIDKEKEQFLELKAPKEKDHFITISENDWQSGVMKPTKADGEYKYIFAMVNITTRQLEVEPMKDFTGHTLVEALDRILSRTKISVTYLLVDDQKPFHDREFVKYCQSEKIEIVYASQQRTTQRSIIKYYEYIIREYINLKSTAEKLEGKSYNDWTSFLNAIVLTINNFNKNNYPRYNINKISDMVVPIDSGELLDLHTIVYPKLFKAENIIEDPNDKYGFSKNDLKYNYTQPKEIIGYMLRAGRPVRYRLKGINDTTFTRNELIVKK